MACYNLYYRNNPCYNLLNAVGLVGGALTATNLLTYCPKYFNKFPEIYMIGVSSSVAYFVYLSYNDKYCNSFLSNFKNSFVITMCGSLIYCHPLSSIIYRS